MSQEVFRELVRRYIEVSDQLEQANPLKKLKTQLTKQILEYMKENDVAQLNLREGDVLVLKQVKAAAPVSKDYIEKQLASEMGQQRAEEIVKALWTNRAVSTKEQLKRIKNNGEEEGA